MMNILLLNGHGGNPWDIGAKGCGFQEANLTRECIDHIQKTLKLYANVFRYPRERDAYQDIVNGIFQDVLYQNFGTIKFDYAFELHFNAFNGNAYGTECFVTSEEKEISVEKVIMQKLKKYFILRDNDNEFDGIKRSNFLVINTLKKMDVSSALLEVCFIDNPSDMKIWKEKELDICEDIVNGIKEGFGLS